MAFVHACWVVVGAQLLLGPFATAKMLPDFSSSAPTPDLSVTNPSAEESVTPVSSPNPKAPSLSAKEVFENGVAIGTMETRTAVATERLAAQQERLEELQRSQETAAQNLRDAELRERDMWLQARDQTAVRQMEDVRVASAKAAQAAQLAALADDREGAANRMRAEHQDRLTAENLALQREQEKYQQTVRSGRVVMDLETEEARLDGAREQKSVDKKEITDLKKMLQAANVAAAGMQPVRDQTAAFAAKAGQRMGIIAKGFKSDSKDAAAVAASLGDAAFEAKALTFQTAQAEGAGVQVDLN